MQPKKMMGWETPGDQRVPVPVRDWNGMKLALWRSKVAWDIAERAAREIVERCKHMTVSDRGVVASICPGAHQETEPCLQQCPDREQRMSALVVLNAARMFAPIDARQPANGPYFAPSRESFSETVAELAIVQLENDALREALRRAGGKVPTPPENTEPRLAPRREAPQLVEYDPDEVAPQPEETLT